LAKTYAVIKFL